jgi:NADH dehydrogenase FAD-containing subunit
MAPPTVIVIGAGPSGISMAYTLKHKLGFDDFTVRKFPPNPSFHPIKALVSWEGYK